MSNTHSANASWDKLWSLQGRVALITGGGTGLGRAMANAFASQGAKVYITGRRLEVLQKAAQSTFEGNGKLIPFQMDVASKPSIVAAVNRIKTEDGKLDILVNNAAVYGFKERPSLTAQSPPDAQTMGEYGEKWFEALEFKEWGLVAETNVASVFFVTMAFLSLLEESTKDGHGDASVINISAAGPHMSLSFGNYPYQILKAAHMHLTKVLATELALRQAPVRVNAIAPGVFPSEATGTPDAVSEFVKTNNIAINPIPMRRPGRDEDMATIAVYLASPASAYMHGQEIVIDGGITAVNPS